MAILSWRSHKKKTKLDVESKPKVNRYHCVELTMPIDADACDTATKLHGRRFLSAEAPSIPLAGCDQRRCRCRFKHHDDRRHELRRDPFSTAGIHTLYSEQKNRRLGGDRRRSSHTAVHIGMS